MAGQKVDNSALEAAIETFRSDKERDSYVKVMELLEKSIVIVPAIPPKDMDPALMEQLKEGKPVQFSKDTKIVPCLLRKETGNRRFPSLLLPEQIPEDKKSPMVIAMPFMGVISMVSANQGRVSEVVVNPFTGMMVLNKSILEIAEKRRKAVGQMKTVQLTPEQFQDFAHNRVSLFLLPKFLFEQKEEGLSVCSRRRARFFCNFTTRSIRRGRRAAAGRRISP